MLQNAIIIMSLFSSINASSALVGQPNDYTLPSGFKRGANGNITVGGEIIIERILISTGSGSVSISTSGFDGSDGPVTFSSSVIITGDLEVRSAKAKSIYIPNGGIHLSEAVNTNTAPGQMFSKNIKTSTLTFVGSAMLWQDEFGVVKATMTRTSLDMGNGEVIGKVKNNNSGAGAPPAGDCDEVRERGLSYVSQTPSRIYFCVDNGLGGAEWRYSNLSP